MALELHCFLIASRFCLPNVCEDVNAFLQHFYEINGILQKYKLCFVST